VNEDRRKQKKIDPLGNRGYDFALRLLIYVAVFATVWLIGKLAGWW